MTEKNRETWERLHARVLSHRLHDERLPRCLAVLAEATVEAAVQTAGSPNTLSDLMAEAELVLELLKPGRGGSLLRSELPDRLPTDTSWDTIHLVGSIDPKFVRDLLERLHDRDVHIKFYFATNEAIDNGYSQRGLANDIKKRRDGAIKALHDFERRRNKSGSLVCRTSTWIGPEVHLPMMLGLRENMPIFGAWWPSQAETRPLMRDWDPIVTLLDFGPKERHPLLDYVRRATREGIAEFRIRDVRARILNDDHLTDDDRKDGREPLRFYSYSPVKLEQKIAQPIALLLLWGSNPAAARNADPKIFLQRRTDGNSSDSANLWSLISARLEEHHVLAALDINELPPSDDAKASSFLKAKLGPKGLLPTSAFTKAISRECYATLSMDVREHRLERIQLHRDQAFFEAGGEMRAFYLFSLYLYCSSEGENERESAEEDEFDEIVQLHPEAELKGFTLEEFAALPSSQLNGFLAHSHSHNVIRPILERLFGELE